MTALTFARAQQLVWQNKCDKGFNTTNVEREFCLTMGELGEAYTAWRKHHRPPPRWRRRLAALRIRRLPRQVAPAPVREEVADAIAFLLGLAEMLGFDAGEALEAKIAVNAARQYRQLPGGTHAKVS